MLVDFAYFCITQGKRAIQKVSPFTKWDYDPFRFFKNDLQNLCQYGLF
jgi:hypothetical protein